MDTGEAARRWADTWKRSWEAQDAETIVALYHPDTQFSTHPFRVAHRGRAGVRGYVSQAFGEEEDVRAWVGTPVVQGDRAAIEWWAALIENGVETTLAGTSVLRFDRDGLVVEQRDTWNQSNGRGEPPDGWGR
ncbi:MAG TPA: nuclear transport factor 2 family protein [Candidatus Limnocylindria bacterium]|jgi:ketosteroid isomerase-like protein